MKRWLQDYPFFYAKMFWWWLRFKCSPTRRRNAKALAESWRRTAKELAKSWPAPQKVPEAEKHK